MSDITRALYDDTEERSLRGAGYLMTIFALMLEIA